MNGFEFRRRMAGLTQEQAAKLIGVTKGAISMWENDQTQPDPERLSRIAKTYGCKIQDLFKEVKA